MNHHYAAPTIQRDEWTTQSAVYSFHGIMADYREKIRAYRIDTVRPYAQYERAVQVSYKRPRKRTAESHTIARGTSYVEIHDTAGNLVYDSRTDIPLEDNWETTRRTTAINFKPEQVPQ